MKVLIVHDGASQAQLKQCEDWLLAASCELVLFDLSESENSLVALIEQCDVVLFLLTPKLPMADATLGILSAKGKGKKIVGAMLTNVPVPADFDKFASALAPFNQDAIVSNVCGDAADWTDSRGEKRPPREVRRHKC